MTDLDAFARASLDGYLALVREHESTLTALDEQSGDGDFGHNLSHGLERAASRAAGAPDSEVWRSLATAFLDEVGGTSGPLFGLLFQAIARAADHASTPAEAIGNGSRDGLAAVQRVGEAQVGDRTLVDALQPAVDALAAEGDLDSAADAACRGAADSARLRARMGRASYVGERAVGHPDPGAVGIAMLFVACAQATGSEPPGAFGELTGSR